MEQHQYRHHSRTARAPRAHTAYRDSSCSEVGGHKAGLLHPMDKDLRRFRFSAYTVFTALSFEEATSQNGALPLMYAKFHFLLGEIALDNLHLEPDLGPRAGLLHQMESDLQRFHRSAGTVFHYFLI